MSEYRNRTTGDVKTQGQWRKSNPNTSFPRIWSQQTLDFLDLEPVIYVDPPSVGDFERVNKSGATQNSDGEWVTGWEVIPLFEDTTVDGVTTTRAQHESAHQQLLNENADASNRKMRVRFLNECDWTQMPDSPIAETAKASWAEYRQALRDITSHANWPHLDEADWPTKP